jgi:3-oxoacyl-[acyl-carrier-protein] synthase II
MAPTSAIVPRHVNWRMTTRSRRVVITGLGVVAPNGIGKEPFWENLLKGASAVDLITGFNPSSHATKIAAEVRDFDVGRYVDPKQGQRMWRVSQFGVAAAVLAVEDAGLRLAPSRTAVCFGSTFGGVGRAAELHASYLSKGSIRHMLPIFMESLPHATTTHLTAVLGVTGPSLTISSNCCTGLDAIQLGRAMVSSGQADVALAVASETPIFPDIVAGFSALGLLSTRNHTPSLASRPYDRLRDGLVLAEGSGALVLEDLESAIGRNASIYTEVVGYAAGTDPATTRTVDTTGPVLADVIKRALDSARLDQAVVDYISAHGSSLPFTDLCDTAAFKTAFGRRAYRIPISSIKSMLGQAISAGSMFQAISCCLATRDGVLPPTINQEVSDPDCDLDYVPNRARAHRVDYALVTAHGMGGNVAALILRCFGA